MISYGPFGDPVRAKIGLNHLIRKKLGVARAQNMGIVWQDGDEIKFLQQPIPYLNGYSEMVVVKAEHVRKPTPIIHKVSNGALAWSAANAIGDVVFTYMAVTAFSAAIVVAVDAFSAAGITVGAVGMLAFLGVEAVDSIFLIGADGTMLAAESYDRMNGGHLAQSITKNKYYNFIETWGPIIALPAVAHDIYLGFQIPRNATLLADLRSQMFVRAKEVLREMRATEVFIGGEGDMAARESYAFLKESVHEIGENLEDIKRDFRKLSLLGVPADMIGLINDEWHWNEIEGGMMADLTEMDMWLRAGTARANLSTPRYTSTAYGAARFGGIYNTTGNPKMRVKSLFPITVHLIGGTHAKPVKGSR